MDISYEYYRIFYYVVKYKNFTQAAEALHNNQPNISRTIKLLEHEIGCRLLIRSNRGISLTPEGERLYSHVKIAVEQIQAAEEELAAAAGLQKGVVTIGVSETALRLLLLPILNQFKRKYPEIHIRISNHLTNHAIESVKNGQVDFAVAAITAITEKSLTAQPIMSFQDILIGGPSHASTANIPLFLKDLSQYPLICLGEDTMTYHFYEDFYRSHQLTLKPELEAAATDQILLMIKNDLGIGFIPEIFAKEALAQKEVCKLSLIEEIPRRQICFVEHTGHPLSVAAATLKKMLLEAVN